MHDTHLLRPRLCAMTPLSLLFSYFTIGFCTVFPSLAASYIMVNTLDFSAADVANTGLLCSIPWCLKPLWAYISDTFSCCGYRRRPYVCLFALLTALLTNHERACWMPRHSPCFDGGIWPC